MRESQTKVVDDAVVGDKDLSGASTAARLPLLVDAVAGWKVDIASLMVDDITVDMRPVLDAMLYIGVREGSGVHGRDRDVAGAGEGIRTGTGVMGSTVWIRSWARSDSLDN